MTWTRSASSNRCRSRFHYDDFFRPLDASMGLSTNVNLAQVPDEVGAISRDFQVAALPLLGALSGSGSP